MENPELPRFAFFYGRDFASDDDLNARWLDSVANVRVHGTRDRSRLKRLRLLRSLRSSAD